LRARPARPSPRIIIDAPCVIGEEFKAMKKLSTAKLSAITMKNRKVKKIISRTGLAAASALALLQAGPLAAHGGADHLHPHGAEILLSAIAAAFLLLVAGRAAFSRIKK